MPSNECIVIAIFQELRALPNFAPKPYTMCINRLRSLLFWKKWSLLQAHQAVSDEQLL